MQILWFIRPFSYFILLFFTFFFLFPVILRHFYSEIESSVDEAIKSDYIFIVTNKKIIKICITAAQFMTKIYIFRHFTTSIWKFLGNNLTALLIRKRNGLKAYALLLLKFNGYKPTSRRRSPWSVINAFLRNYFQMLHIYILFFIFLLISNPHLTRLDGNRFGIVYGKKFCN